MNNNGFSSRRTREKLNNNNDENKPAFVDHSTNISRDHSGVYRKNGQGTRNDLPYSSTHQVEQYDLPVITSVTSLREEVKTEPMSDEDAPCRITHIQPPTTKPAQKKTR